MNSFNPTFIKQPNWGNWETMRTRRAGVSATRAKRDETSTLDRLHFLNFTGTCLQNGVVLPRILGVVALQQAAAHGGARTCKLGHVEVGEAQLGSREQQRELTPPSPRSHSNLSGVTR